MAIPALPANAEGTGPLSAIDWLTQSIDSALTDGQPGQRVPPPGATVPGAEPGSAVPADPLFPSTITPPFLQGLTAGVISVSLIDSPTLDGAGLVPAERMGLPRAFWGPGSAERLGSELRSIQADALPALSELLRTLLVTEFDPPSDPTGRGALFLARIDMLVDRGALDQALALIGGVGTGSPELFARWFDIALLLGEEDTACAALRARSSLAPDYASRIFCLARGGDWMAAALTLRSAQSLGLLDEQQSALLIRFLEPDLSNTDLDVRASAQRPSPLEWRMLEAIGEQVPTRGLPVAFAQGDLRSNIAWRNQIEAAERLARTGAIPVSRLLGLYRAGSPAASGGVWDRVAAIQALETALDADDPLATGAALLQAWPLLAAIDLEIVLTGGFAARLLAMPLEGEAAGLAFRIGLLGADHAEFAAQHLPVDSVESFLIALSRGDPAAADLPAGAQAAAIREAFAAPVAPALRLQPDAAGTGQLGIAGLSGFQPESEAETQARTRPEPAPTRPMGEDLMRALRLLDDGAAGDLRSLTEGLTLLRAIGLESVARRVALQVMILDRRG